MKQFSPFSVVIATVVFYDKSGAKRRPVLLLRAQGNLVFAFSITSQYAKKSKYIQARYYEIIDWLEAGLKKPSWIDTITRIKLDSQFDGVKVIGQLTRRDREQLLKFLNS